MSSTARRDGTPDKPEESKSRGGFRSRSRTRSTGRSRSGGTNAQPSRGEGNRRSRQRTNADNAQLNDAATPTVSHAKPARHQHARRPHTHGNPFEHAGEGVRLQKVLAQAGVGSRRTCEEFITQGRVEVNGEIITRQGVRIDPNNAVVRVDGVRVRIDESLVYMVLNKPRGVQCTMSDDMGRPCVGDIIDERVTAGQRLFHVGRLDADTEGLLLITNDGELANRLMHPRYEVTKTYLAEVLGEPDRRVLRQLRDGVELDDGVAVADKASVIDVNQGRALVRVDVHEGRKHIVRRMLKEVGFPVQRLVRTKIHTVQQGEQTPGALRVLNDAEVRSLYKAVDL